MRPEIGGMKMIERRMWLDPRSTSWSLLLVGLIGTLALVSCAPARAPAVDTEAMARRLTQLDDDWSRSAATRNADSVAAFYAVDAIAYPPGAPVAVGHDAARKVWADGFADTTYRISWKTDHAGASRSGELGYTAGTFEESYMGPDHKPVAKKGKYACVWAKQPDGTWKAIHDIWNYDSN